MQQETDNFVMLVTVDGKVFLNFLKGAQKRMTIAKPGYFVEEVQAIMQIVTQKNIPCTVYMDPDEKAVRYGFGEVKALELISQNSAILNPQTAQRIRMAVAIVDDLALLYTPVALAWEQEPEQITFPNGIVAGKTLAESILARFNNQPQALPELPKNVIPFPGCKILKQEEKALVKELGETIEKLKKNPPVDPANLKEIPIYRNKYKLLKTEVRGVNVKNKTISLKPFTSKVDIDKRLKNSWTIFSPEDLVKISQYKEFKAKIRDIMAEYTIDAMRFGYLIAVDRKAAFQESLNKAQNEMKEKIKKNIIEGILKESRDKLAEYLTVQVKDKKNCWGDVFKGNTAILDMLNRKELDEKTVLKNLVYAFIDHTLNFPEADKFIDSINIECIYMDISDELLNNEDFMGILKSHGDLTVQVREYGKGYEKGQDQETLFP